MSARDWMDKDFYGELGVSSDASSEEIKKAYRKLARELHPDANPGDAKAEARFKAVSEAHGVLSDPAKRKEYDEARSLFAAGGGRGFGGGRPGAGMPNDFDLNDLFGQARNGGFQADPGSFNDLFGGLFGKSGGQQASRPQRGGDVETEVRLDFADATKGAVVPLRLTSPAACTTCHGSGAKPGTHPRSCPTCGGAGVVSRNQGAFGFSEPCRDCRGTGSLVDDPCPECRGTGTTTRTRTITVRIPAGVDDGQRIRLAGQGEAGLRGAPAGDLFVTVHVTPDPVFRRDGNNLTITVPVSFGELALGTTLSVPTLDGRVKMKVPAGSANGRVLRLRGRGVSKRDGQAGDLLVTLEAAVPPTLSPEAQQALQAYVEAERASGFDPRARWAGAMAGDR
ncbi:molecular chaperone DnaJ [Rhodococcus sp. X156]|uniref:molecular chaperone DnaJ n=1 Tax=Rhodococcus sp. X156 TaxID=2499145 RepID=UPI000FDA3E0C|nr:molecular chaperone DnaJ [Rhodococcus sp. X156]